MNKYCQFILVSINVKNKNIIPSKKKCQQYSHSENKNKFNYYEKR